MVVKFRGIEAEAPSGAVIGIVGERGSGADELLRAISGAARYAGPGDPLDLSPAPVLLIDHALAALDAVQRAKAGMAIDRLRRGGATILLVSHDETVLRDLSDEVWWIHENKLAGRGDPGEVLDAWRRHVSACVRAWGATASSPLAPRFRRGDGRAEILRIETIGEDGRPTMVWRSGELAVVRVSVCYRAAVADPVIGLLIRTRIGLNVYGTNTELEKLPLGPVGAGGSLSLDFAFRCELCPQEYTITVASHDPDGVWHDWLEDAVAVTVVDDRYTAGVANLRATVRRV